MSEYSQDYFKQAEHGESRWWSWIMVFWFTMLGWLGSQLVFTSPVSTILQEIDPELGTKLNEASLAMLSGDNVLLLGILILIFLVSTALGALFWLIHRTTKDNVRNVFGILTGLSVLASFASFFKMLPLMNSPELTALNGQIIAASPVVLMLILLTFPGSLAAPYLGQKFLHKRTIKSLHTAASKIRWKRGLQAFLITWVVLGSITAILHLTGISPVRTNFGAGRFLAYGLVCLLFLPLQSGTEEIIFRGYLNQGFTHILKNKWIAFIITSLMFMAMHLANPEALAGKESGILALTMSSYFIFGFVACLMVWMDDGLESAIGFHAANNTFAGIFVNYEGSVLPTPSLFMGTSNPHIDVYVAIGSLGLIAFILWKTRKPVDFTA